jgi:hypothetical protein
MLFVLSIAIAWSYPSDSQAVPVSFQFNGTSTSPTGATVSALLQLDSAFVLPNGSFNQGNLGSFQLQFNGTFSGSTNAIPASLSGQFNPSGTIFSSVFANISLTIPSFAGTDNFQFFGLNGNSWTLGLTGPAPGPATISGTGLWTQAAPVPEPGTIFLLLAGLAGLIWIKWMGASKIATQARRPRRR